MNPIERMLRERIGLDPASIGPGALRRAVRARLRALRLSSEEAYRNTLVQSKSEWAELVESVVVGESWFFRDRALFDAFARLAARQWLPAHPDRPLRVLSLPCASGEEPYSIAMALTLAQVPAARFRITAVDLSARALARAAVGWYGPRAFRGKDLGLRERFFERVGQGYLINAAIRGCARFSQGNLLSDEFPEGRARWDFVFCRNLLIYFDPATQRRALEKLARLLVPGGFLFVGAAEQALLLQQGFVSARLPMAFVGAPARVAEELAASCPDPGAFEASLAKAPPLGEPEPERIKAVDRTSGGSGALRVSLLDRARKLTEAGQLQEAAALCEAHLAAHRDSVEAHYLLGRVLQLGGDPAAAECYRRALYLNPNHGESLVQMAALARREGDLGKAANFKRRAERLVAATVSLNQPEVPF